MRLLAGVKGDSVDVCTGSERGRAEAAEAAVLTAQHKLEALEAAQAQHAEHVQSLSGQVGQRLKVRPVLGHFAHQGSSKIPAIAQNMTPRGKRLFESVDLQDNADLIVCTDGAGQSAADGSCRCICKDRRARGEVSGGARSQAASEPLLCSSLWQADHITPFWPSGRLCIGITS